MATSRTIGGVSFNGGSNIDLPGVNTAGNQDTSGNAATATILATSRTIGGVSFVGSANIDLPGVNTAGNQDTSGNAATSTLSSTVTITEGSLTNEETYLTFVDGISGSKSLEVDSNLKYNPSTNSLDVNASASFKSIITGNFSTDEESFILFTSGDASGQTLKTNNNFRYNSDTDTLKVENILGNSSTATRFRIIKNSWWCKF